MAKGPARIGDILSELLMRRGLARVQGAEALEEAWTEAAGPLAAQYSRVAGVRRGKLEVVVANSTLIQEFTFQKNELIKKLQGLLPDEKIADLRFRVGAVKAN